MVRTRVSNRPLPRVDGLTPEERLKAEDENVRCCLASARALDRLPPLLNFPLDRYSAAGEG
jgi:hypothetical protein